MINSLLLHRVIGWQMGGSRFKVISKAASWSVLMLAIAALAMLSDESLKGEVALPFPLSHMQQLFTSFDLSFPFVVGPACWLDKASQASLPFFDLWNDLIDAAHEAALVTSSS
jgi:hypothetical protein